jgi:PAS domain S-box-containing protein
VNSKRQAEAFLDDRGTMGGRIRDHDWSGHPLGAPAGWPAALRTILGVMLSSSFPTFLAWGDDLLLFFNDAYRPMLGNKVDDALGQPLRTVWHEAWDSVGPHARRVLQGESFFFENYPTTLERHGYPEQAWFTFSYSPVHDELGEVRGLICTVIEDTEKVLALARHKEAEERLALSLEASGNIGTWSYDLEDGATHVDERFARLFQVDAALARSGTELERFTNMIDPQDRPRMLEEIAAAIRDDTLYDTDYRIPQRSGHTVWVNARGKVFTDPASGRRRFAGIAVDITARKAAEQARVDSERKAAAAALQAAETGRRLDALLDAAPVGIVYVDAGGRMLASNATNRSIWGTHPESLCIDEYAEWKGWWPPGTARAGQPVAAHEWPLGRALDGASSGADHASGMFEIEPFGQPGTRKTILVRASVIRDQDGTVAGAVAANMDITAQVAAERALLESEARFRLIANVIPQIVWSSDATGVGDYVNERWQSFTGIPARGPDGEGWHRAVHPDDLPALLRAWQVSLAADAPFEVEHRLRHHAGAYRWVLNRGLPVCDEMGRVRRWMGTLTDIHDQKTGEEELRAAARRKDEFLAMLAHELRNPLAPISNAAQLLALAGANPARVRQSSEVIIRQVGHMTDLVDDLLDVSRVTRGLVELERERLDLRAVVAGAVEQARPLIEARGHALHTSMDAAGAWVDGDRTRLVQILSNLLNNAAKYTPQGGRIALSVATDGGQARIEVRDNGIGIAPSMLPHVFDLFTQAERTPDRAQGGLGLGLALVRSLAQLHGGRVEAHSEGAGQGSAFTLVLPLAEGVPASPVAPDVPAPGASAAPGEAPRGIMIVDDNADAADSLADILRSLGHATVTATGSHEALALAGKAAWPDLFILDIGLPDIDGYELVRRLRAQAPPADAARYVALTGYGQAHDRVLSRSAGFDHHFVKPVDLAALLEVIGGSAA